MSNKDTIFSKIARGDVPAYVLYEDEDTMAFLDNNPVTKGHCLVISKEPIDHLDDCDEILYAKIFSTVQKVSKLLKVRLSPERIALIVHGFEVPHAHVHVLPVYSHGDIKFPARPDTGTTAAEFENILSILKDK